MPKPLKKRVGILASSLKAFSINDSQPWQDANPRPRWHLALADTIFKEHRIKLTATMK